MKRSSGIGEPGLFQPLLVQITAALAASDEPVTAGAISFLVGRGARGALGADPAPEVAAALATLVAGRAVVALPICSVCHLPGEVYEPAGRTARRPHAAPRDDGESPRPPPDGGLEIGERPELIEQGCCRRVARPWRRASRAG